jgi:NADH dehydrogenase/NADH:ubiquinone oxidoreductase subunit G
MKINFLLGADKDLGNSWQSRRNNKITIYQGHHGNTGAASANYILPSTSFVEKKASFVNFQGRLQQTQKAISENHGPQKQRDNNQKVLTDSQARDDWKILAALGSQVVKQCRPQSQCINTKKSIIQILQLENKSQKEQWRLFKVLSHLTKGHFSTSLGLDTGSETFPCLYSSQANDNSRSTGPRAILSPEFVSSKKAVCNQSFSLAKTWKTNWVPLYDNFYLTDVISQASVTMAKCSAQLNHNRFFTVVGHEQGQGP